MKSKWYEVDVGLFFFTRNSIFAQMQIFIHYQLKTGNCAETSSHLTSNETDVYGRPTVIA